MFKTEDTVLYSSRGICKITDKSENFYTLSPIYGKDIIIRVPYEAESKMKKVLSKEEIDAMIKSIGDMEWISDDKERQIQFKKILLSGDRQKIISLIRLIYLHQKELKRSNKKFHIADERIFKEAEALLYDEFAYVLNIKRENVIKYIGDIID